MGLFFKKTVTTTVHVEKNPHENNLGWHVLRKEKKNKPVLFILDKILGVSSQRKSCSLWYKSKLDRTMMQVEIQEKLMHKHLSHLLA